MRKIATINLGHQPSLTVEKAAETISKHFGYPVGQKLDKFVTVVKNSMISAIVKVQQTETTTKITVSGVFPKYWIDILFLFLCLFTGAGCIVWIVYAILHLGFENELTAFIKNNPDFYPDNKPQ